MSDEGTYKKWKAAQSGIPREFDTEEFWAKLPVLDEIDFDELHEPYERREPFDRQEGGDHYSKMQIQPLDYIMANQLDFCAGNVVKYVTRAVHKGQELEDWRKAKHYCELRIAQLERELRGGWRRE